MTGPRSWKDRLGQSHKSDALKTLIDRPRTQPKLARLLLALSIAAILFCGLFPFDLDLHDFSAQVSKRFDTSFSQYFTSGDTVENILFFMPLGFSLIAVILLPLRRRVGAKIEKPLCIVALLVGLSISTLIELLQCGAIERDPSLTDIVNNTLGGGIGAGIYLLIGERFLSIIAAQIERWQRKLGLSAVATITAIYAVTICVAPVFIGADAGKLSRWNPSFCLALGNEINANRSWIGKVWDISIADRAATISQVTSLLQNSSPREVMGDSLLAMYDARGEAPFADRTGNLPPLQLAARAATQPTSAPVKFTPITPTTKHKDAATAPADAMPWDINPDTWLRTAQPVGVLSDAIARSSEFTVAFTASSAKRDQDQASRILTISRGSEDRNLTFAQNNDDLVVRIACGATGKNGDAPEFVLNDVFSDARPRRIIATFADSQLHVYVNSLAWNAVARITPEASIIWSLYPRDYWKFEMNSGEIAILTLIYRMMTFLPLGALAAITVNLVRRSYWERIPIAVGIVIATAVLLEGLRGAIGGHHLNLMSFLASLVCGAIGIAVIGVRRSLPWTR